MIWTILVFLFNKITQQFELNSVGGECMKHQTNQLILKESHHCFMKHQHHLEEREKLKVNYHAYTILRS